MSVREEEGNKNCPSRGLGIAAAAIGVGVGAALYYFFSKRSENPDNEGATSSNWNAQQSHALSFETDSYTTLSEHSTTDTSMIESELDSSHNTTASMSEFSPTDSDESNNSVDSSNNSIESSDFNSSYDSNNSSFNESYNMSDLYRIESDSETNMEFDVVNSIEPLETSSILISLIGRLGRVVSPRLRRDKAEQERLAALRQQAFRERSWTGEQCSICFDVMLRHQDVLVLPCSHRFHQDCILPWLQEKQTCPYCRKEA